ncbi:nicotinate-nucleotide--dimethylbenzimidazole phosphoribosyltransferase [Psychromonas sp. Urea-02u-13]|uniref:nicotinate-nucleotide--dimethylbenzimidazole phosphoribosyltransferase n=1 Tax=Psychromonas sp. Urea-02u-13 TaxID=2058326 RepID=UPI001E4E05BB|nr:nicotinate-nucleotide--dimethylbenzimidazole phosphoribosyltransferase [Psychromonas sp. Urea-02u-13]
MFVINSLMKQLPLEFLDNVKQVIDLKTKPQGSLGALEGLASKIAHIQHSISPVLKNPCLIIFAADHGIADQGVSLFPKAVTEQMVLNFLAGGAAINCFSRQHDLDLNIVNAGVCADFNISDAHFINAPIAKGTNNFLETQAMSEAQCQQALNQGAEIVVNKFNAGCNVIGFGEMGIANTTSAAAIMAALLNLSGEACAGRGTGVDDKGVTFKAKVIEQALELHQLRGATVVQILQKVGGFEIVMMVGAMLKAAELSMLVLVDGFICSVAALAASKMNEHFIDYTQFCHQSNEQAHQRVLEHLGVQPLLNLGLRLGEGSGVAIAYPLIVSAVTFFNEMASFADAGVSESE